MKEWFKARNIWGAAIMALSDAEAGRLAKALWAYTMSGERQNLSGAEKGVFAMILMTLGQDEGKEADISAKRAAAGALGGRQNGAKEANAYYGKQNEANEAIACNKNKNIEKDIKEKSEREKKPLARFTPPTREDLIDFCREQGLSVDIDRFLDYYTSNGWMVGKNHMKNWQATARNWARDSKATSGKPVAAQNYEQREYNDVQDEARQRLIAMMNPA